MSLNALPACLSSSHLAAGIQTLKALRHIQCMRARRMNNGNISAIQTTCDTTGLMWFVLKTRCINGEWFPDRYMYGPASRGNIDPSSPWSGRRPRVCLLDCRQGYDGQTPPNMPKRQYSESPELKHPIQHIHPVEGDMQSCFPVLLWPLVYHCAMRYTNVYCRQVRHC